MKKSLILLLVALLALTGCTAAEEPAAEQPAEEPSAEAPAPYEGDGWSSAHYSEDMAGATLNLYGVTDTIIPVLEDFEADTGIKVENLTMKNGEILQRLESEKESGVVIADIWFTGGADTFINAAANDLLLAYASPQGEALDAIMKDADGYWHGTSLTLVNWVVNTQLLEEKGLDMPTTWDDLLQEGLRGEVSMSDPNSSGTAYNVVSAMLETKGEEEGWTYLEALIDQVPFFTPRGSDPAKLAVSGEAIVGINASNGDRELEENNAHIKLVYPEDGTGWWPQPVAIVNGTEHLDEAKVFVDWLLSPRGMESIAFTRNAAVARTDVEIPEGIVALESISLFPTDFQANAEKRDAVLAMWNQRVQP